MPAHGSARAFQSVIQAGLSVAAVTAITTTVTTVTTVAAVTTITTANLAFVYGSITIIVQAIANLRVRITSRAFRESSRGV
jgi:hypothetical protein